MSTQLKNVVCAISGGVDSCVAALLLKKKGFRVQGVFMRNWDVVDETGYCQADKDKEDAEYICNKIGIPFLEVNFVKEYWNNVFSDLIKDYTTGLTPNPDILCNKRIKFNTFYKFAFKELNADAIATGHYARVLETADKDVHLLKGVDQNKDQTFFLSQIPQYALRKCLFPLGNMTKDAVKKIAHTEGFSRIANKKESMGICFIGRRKFQSFIDDYIQPVPGNFINIEDGCIVGQHKGIHCWTVGQRCLIPGQLSAFFVVEKNSSTQEIIVAPGSSHPALFSQSMVTEMPYWISTSSPTLLTEQAFECDFRFQHRDPLVKCLVYKDDCGHLHVLLEEPLKALTPGQYAVFYKGEECLGSARILYTGPSVYALKKAQNLHPT